MCFREKHSWDQNCSLATCWVKIPGKSGKHLSFGKLMWDVSIFLVIIQRFIFNVGFVLLPFTLRSTNKHNHRKSTHFSRLTYHQHGGKFHGYVSFREGTPWKMNNPEMGIINPYKWLEQLIDWAYNP